MPELALPYRGLLREGGGEQPGQHIVFEAVLVPFLFAQLQSPKAKPLLKRAFAFLEEMAADPDGDVRDVVGQAVGESLWGHDDLVARARKFMGPATVKVIDAAWDLRFRAR